VKRISVDDSKFVACVDLCSLRVGRTRPVSYERILSTPRAVIMRVAGRRYAGPVSSARIRAADRLLPSTGARAQLVKALLIELVDVLGVSESKRREHLLGTMDVTAGVDPGGCESKRREHLLGTMDVTAGVDPGGCETRVAVTLVVKNRSCLQFELWVDRRIIVHVLKRRNSFLMTPRASRSSG
jgi:hypothetical protein